ncbi:hypothetical protein J6590_100358, partial [Homalodisca vitripennis]
KTNIYMYIQKKTHTRTFQTTPIYNLRFAHPKRYVNSEGERRRNIITTETFLIISKTSVHP